MRALLSFFAVALPVSALAQASLFSVPADATAPRRSRLGGAPSLIDCAAHGAWTAPDGWDAAELASGDVVAIAPDGRALLARGTTSGRHGRITTTERFLERVGALVAQLADGAPTLGTVAEEARSRWHVERAVDGTASRAGTPLRVRAESDGERRLWVTLSVDAAHDAELDAAIDGWRMLTSHACVCGYDCDHPPAE
jgi:hypothetical protein